MSEQLQDAVRREVPRARQDLEALAEAASRRPLPEEG